MAQTTPVVMAHGMEEQAWWGLKVKAMQYLGFSLVQSRLNDARIR